MAAAALQQKRGRFRWQVQLLDDCMYDISRSALLGMKGLFRIAVRFLAVECFYGTACFRNLGNLASECYKLNNINDVGGGKHEAFGG